MWPYLALSFFTLLIVCRTARLPYPEGLPQKQPYRVFYQVGQSEESLPECGRLTVCNRVDTYARPWVERMCRCPKGQECPTSLDPQDGYTVLDKSRQFKMCQPVSTLPSCRYFRDPAWTYVTLPDNTTVQTMYCLCPKHSVAYIVKHKAFHRPEGTGYRYSFACSPQSKLRCQRKEPCRLFTVKKRPDLEDVNTNSLCQCPHGHRCPSRHTEPSVVAGTNHPHDQVKTFSGYCSP